MSRETKLSHALYAGADIQGKASQATADELRELGDDARKLETALAEMCEVYAGEGNFADADQCVGAFERARELLRSLGVVR